MTKTEKYNLQKKAIDEAAQKLARENEANDAEFVERTTRPLFR